MNTPKIQKLVLASALAACVVIASVVALGLHKTLHGLTTQICFSWTEDSFNGRLLSELRRDLANRERDLVPVDSDSFTAITGRRLESHQRALRFIKGGEYPWFGGGTAVNVGYVITEIEGDTERIVAILHGRSVDSL